MRRTTRRLLGFYGMRRPLSVLALVGIDAGSLVCGLVVAAYLISKGLFVDDVLLFAPILLVVWIAIFAAHGLYDRASSRRNVGNLLGAILWGAGLLTFGSVVYPQVNFQLGETLLAAALVFLACGRLRALYERGVDSIYRRGFGRIPTLVVGKEENRKQVLDAMEKKPGAYTSAGELDLFGDGGGANLAPLREALDRTRVRDVILAGAEKLGDTEFLDLLRSMRLRKVRVRMVPGVAAMVGRPVLSEDIGIPLLEVDFPELDNAQRALKRMLDLAGSSLGILLLSPLLLGTALAIKVTSPGPVFFKQKRVGADEEVFLCYKFRSMYQDAEARQAELEAKNEADGVVFKMKSDPRVTPVGRFIRRWSIDELPQLINVLTGEMSLVGPRPLPIRDFEKMTKRHKMRLAAIPGVSGYWQISGRSDLSFEDMVRLDLYYIENWSLSLDIEIILKTVRAVLRHEGAY
jgi:exopolysaccharide biosynthesis polyprenyl glycosylphosphotransferase